MSSDCRFNSNLEFYIPKEETDDLSEISKGKRKWVKESEGIIKNWDDFYNYKWPEPEKVETWVFEYLSEILPENMGIFLCISQGIFEIVMFLFGFEKLCYLIYDNEELVEKVVERVGNIIYEA